jgi:hypothetical protein
VTRSDNPDAAPEKFNTPTSPDRAQQAAEDVATDPANKDNRVARKIAKQIRKGK